MTRPGRSSAAPALPGRFVPGRPGPLMAMVEVTGRCDLACPVCFADSGPAGSDLPPDQVRRSLELLLEVAGVPVPIQISGGEPTVRQDLPEIVALARGMGFRNIELITNGIEIARNPELLPELARRGLTAVYLQFDGLRAETGRKIRGRDLVPVRRAAVEAVRRAGLCCTLAVAVARGVNDLEIGEIVRFGIDNLDTVRAINFQSATRFAGRFELGEEHGGYPLPELLALIEAQSGVPAQTFLSEHMGHLSCNAMSLVFLVNGRLEPLFSYLSREDVLAFLGSRRRETVLDLFAGKRGFFFRHLTTPAAWRLLAQAAPIFGRSPRGVLRSRHILLFAKSFMERHELSPERLDQCCYGIATPEGVFSFCAYNNLYRFPAARRAGERQPTQTGVFHEDTPPALPCAVSRPDRLGLHDDPAGVGSGTAAGADPPLLPRGVRPGPEPLRG